VDINTTLDTTSEIRSEVITLFDTRRMTKLDKSYETVILAIIKHGSNINKTKWQRKESLNVSRIILDHRRDADSTDGARTGSVTA
jgi:hypothetical protein